MSKRQSRRGKRTAAGSTSEPETRQTEDTAIEETPIDAPAADAAQSADLVGDVDAPTSAEPPAASEATASTPDAAPPAPPLGFWERLEADGLSRRDLVDLERIGRDVETRKAQMDRHVGPIDAQAAGYLRAICRRLQPRVIVEIGTGLGYATYALQASEALHTCGSVDAGVPSSGTVHSRPGTRSTEMLQELAAAGVRMDLAFIDGRLHAGDAELLRDIARSDAVLIVDDYWQSARGQEKGMRSIEALRRVFDEHELVEPLPSMQHKLAALVPPGRGEAW